MKTDSTDKKSKISDKLRKELGVCEHNEVSYKTLEKFCKELFLRVKSDTKAIQNLSSGYTS